ncbi:glutaredoxin family protein [Deinococcus cellulosilyticus]|uniref:NrdH-redoxin n=1 Tax=Deinococcus cellulosilyticus (strain DSM 18568 / NBRC 106333 / KACC 11606 / 5516J-15) TaxID=1223518 RepID=A0A511N2A4_DEIC1|nr:glutaredoxin family protein [Deinococcus cellulosilyticus]GEM46637.1 NrdH-redoxin [Deinococcus cellulosilyticus NBRC 106333 = KACC 11606]
MITVYTVPQCSSCEAIKTYLHQRGLAFTEKNVREDPAALQEMQEKTGLRIAPVTVVGERVLYGTFEDQLPELRTLLEGDRG